MPLVYIYLTQEEYLRFSKLKKQDQDKIKGEFKKAVMPDVL
jgi:hypothetical protein